MRIMRDSWMSPLLSRMSLAMSNTMPVVERCEHAHSAIVRINTVSTRPSGSNQPPAYSPARSAPVALMMKCVSAGVEMARAPITPAARRAGSGAWAAATV